MHNRAISDIVGKKLRARARIDLPAGLSPYLIASVYLSSLIRRVFEKPRIR